MIILFVYLADIIKAATFVFSVAGTLGLGASALFGAYMKIDCHKDPKFCYWSVPLSCLFVLVAVALPSKEGMYRIMAAYGAVETVQYLQQSDDAKRIAGKSIQAIEKMLDDAIKENKK